MLGYISVIIVSGALSLAFYAYKSMDRISVEALCANVMFKSGWFGFLAKTGLSRFMRPSLFQIETSEGFKIPACPPISSGVVEEVFKLKLRDDDIFVATYPKAGTTWMQEILWLLCNNADFKRANEIGVQNRVPFMETVGVDNLHGMVQIRSWPRNKQRIIKTHLPYEFLPEEVRSGGKCKIIYVARNAKDLCVSYYHFHRMNHMMPLPGTWNQFLTKFCAGEWGWGSWFPHVLTYWKKYQGKDERIYFTTYEKLKKDLRAQLVPLAEFLEKKLTGEQLDEIAKHCSFSSMSKNPTTNYGTLPIFDLAKSKFMRKGEVGDWKNHFTVNENSAFDALYESKMKGSGLTIPFSI